MWSLSLHRVVTYPAEREGAGAAAVEGVEPLRADNPLAPADGVKVHRQAVPAARG